MAEFLKDIFSYLEERYPPSLSEEWDNIGLLVGNSDSSAEIVLVCLDVTHRVLEKAVRESVDLIISHHPVIFKPIEAITADSAKGRMLAGLIKQGINVYCMHTNFDSAPEGMNQLLANALELINIEITEGGLGRFGSTDKSYTMSEYIKYVKNCLKIKTIGFAGDINARVKKVAVYCGAFDEEYAALSAVKPDVIVTGDVKYHTALDMSENGYNVIDAGHYQTERIMVPEIVRILKRQFKNIEITGFEEDNDVITYY